MIPQSQTNKYWNMNSSVTNRQSNTKCSVTLMLYISIGLICFYSNFNLVSSRVNPLSKHFSLLQPKQAKRWFRRSTRDNENFNFKTRNLTRSYSDLSTWVNPFIGTAHDGDVFAGASVPFGMAKITVDCTGYAPAGYLWNTSAAIISISPLHDSGTGAGGSYGNFGVMPIRCPQGFKTCVTGSKKRIRPRVKGLDEASPGYFAITLDKPVVKLETTSTRRAGLERFTFQDRGSKAERPYFVLDLSHDLSNSFLGGQMTMDPQKGRITLGGKWQTSFTDGASYQAFACYDVAQADDQPLSEYGTWETDANGNATIQPNRTELNFPFRAQPYKFEAGVLFSYPPGTDTITIRLGVSFVSADKACSNAEEEIDDQSFEQVRTKSVQQWNELLGRVEIPLRDTEEDIAVMIYSSMYRSFLTPNNATDEGQGPFQGTNSPYFDSFYCSWDTSRTFFPWMHLHSPKESAEIVESYIDGWRKTGVIPECRANNQPAWSQGGSDGTNILADFAMKYHQQASDLGVNLDDMYKALVDDAENTPTHWETGGRQIDLYTKFGYIPYDPNNTISPGHIAKNRESSRTLEFAFNDFGVRQVAGLLGHQEDFAKYEKRSLWYRNVWNPNVTSDGYKGFFQRRFANGSFSYTDPKACSPKDPVPKRTCFFDTGTEPTGFYESSPWEYSLYAPHDNAHLIELHGGKDVFRKRLNHFFKAGYYLAGNEPGFQTPVMYHYIGKPADSVSRVRSIVRTDFNTEAGGIPGNDDQGAMATLLLFHLLGLYPIPSTTQYLILSPWVPSYTLHNPYLNISTKVRVIGYDKRSLVYPIPKGTPAYVKEVKLNGKRTLSRCFVDFHEVFAVGGDLEITLTADQEAAQSCDGPLPDSVSTGGFPVKHIQRQDRSAD